MVAEEPGEGAAILVHLVNVEILGFFIIISWPVVSRNLITPDQVRVGLIENGVLAELTPAPVPVLLVVLDAIVLEEEAAVTLLRGEKLGLKLDVCDLDVVAEVFLRCNECPNFENSVANIQLLELIVELDTFLLLIWEVVHPTELELVRDPHICILEHLVEVLIAACDPTVALGERT